MPYNLTDEIIKREKAEMERKRKQTLSALKEILDELGSKYGFSKAYIFGSIAKAGRFRRDSDVDIAVFNLRDEHFFSLMAEISRRLERNVDICQMETADERIRRSIEKESVLWKKRD